MKFIVKWNNSIWVKDFWEKVQAPLKKITFAAPVTIFKTLHFLRNLRMGPISSNVTTTGKAYKWQTL